jgi:hypothetical protein
MGLGGGYDFWTSDQWSFGIGGRLRYIEGATDNFGSHRVFIAAFTFSWLLH